MVEQFTDQTLCQNRIFKKYGQFQIHQQEVAYSELELGLFDLDRVDAGNIFAEERFLNLRDLRKH